MVENLPVYVSIDGSKSVEGLPHFNSKTAENASVLVKPVPTIHLCLNQQKKLDSGCLLYLY